MFWTGN